jgi:DNA-binding PadR family transcriptional regulator
MHGPHRGGGRGGRRFSAGFDDAQSGRPAFRTGRKLASEDLQLVLLALLADKPSHGYELIKTLSEKSSGFYGPSSGMVYPALAYLEDIGHATVTMEGTKKRYVVTPEGEAWLSTQRHVADDILAQLASVGAKMAQVRRVFAGEEDADAVAPGTPESLMLARLGLKHALHDLGVCSPEGNRRIAEILQRATDDLRQLKKDLT